MNNTAAPRVPNLLMAVPLVVFDFIGIVFTAVLYGKYHYLITIVSDNHK